MFSGVGMCLIGLCALVGGNYKNKLMGAGLIVVGGSLIANKGQIVLL